MGMAEEPGNRTGLVFDERYLQHNPGLKTLPGGANYPWVNPTRHWPTPRLVQRTKQLIDLSGLRDDLETIPPRMATRDEVAAFHTPGYIARVERLCAEGG